MKPSELEKGQLYFLCTVCNMDGTAPKIATLKYVGESIAPCGGYTLYEFDDPNDQFQIDSRALLERLGEKLEDDNWKPSGGLTTDCTGLESIYDLNGLIKWLEGFRIEENKDEQ